MEEVISVVIPVYNVERYLDKCLESVVNQTYQNLEIILVDDGSTDRCPEICDAWALRDRRIRVIHKSNGGLSDARNVGLDKCNGKYVVFIDSDDYVHEEYVVYLHDLVMIHHAEMAICEFCMITEDGRILNRFSDDGQSIVMDQKQALWELCDERLFSCSACAKIYLTSAFESIRFPVGHVFEDLATCYKLMLNVNTVAFGKRALYNYVRREGSIMTKSFEWRRLDSVRYAEEMCEEILKSWPELFDITRKRLFVGYIFGFKWLVLSAEQSDKAKQYVADYFQKMKRVRWRALHCHMSPKLYIYAGCSFLGKHAMKIAVRTEEFLFQMIKLRRF